MRRRTTFGMSNVTKENNRTALVIFGIGEVIVAGLLSSDWIHDYVWMSRLLPLIPPILSHVKLLFNSEVVGGTKVGEIRAEDGADVEIIETTQPKK